MRFPIPLPSNTFTFRVSRFAVELHTSFLQRKNLSTSLSHLLYTDSRPRLTVRRDYPPTPTSWSIGHDLVDSYTTRPGRDPPKRVQRRKFGLDDGRRVSVDALETLGVNFPFPYRDFTVTDQGSRTGGLVGREGTCTDLERFRSHFPLTWSRYQKFNIIDLEIPRIVPESSRFLSRLDNI